MSENTDPWADEHRRVFVKHDSPGSEIIWGEPGEYHGDVERRHGIYGEPTIRGHVFEKLWPQDFALSILTPGGDYLLPEARRQYAEIAPQATETGPDGSVTPQGTADFDWGTLSSAGLRTADDTYAEPEWLTDSEWHGNEVLHEQARRPWIATPVEGQQPQIWIGEPGDTEPSVHPEQFSGYIQEAPHGEDATFGHYHEPDGAVANEIMPLVKHYYWQVFRNGVKNHRETMSIPNRDAVHLAGPPERPEQTPEGWNPLKWFGQGWQYQKEIEDWKQQVKDYEHGQSLEPQRAEWANQSVDIPPTNMEEHWQHVAPPTAPQEAPGAPASTTPDTSPSPVSQGLTEAPSGPLPNWVEGQGYYCPCGQGPYGSKGLYNQHLYGVHNVPEDSPRTRIPDPPTLASKFVPNVGYYCDCGQGPYADETELQQHETTAHERIPGAFSSVAEGPEHVHDLDRGTTRPLAHGLGQHQVAPVRRTEHTETSGAGEQRLGHPDAHSLGLYTATPDSDPMSMGLETYHVEPQSDSGRYLAPERFYEPDDSSGNNWVYLNGLVLFGTHHHRLIMDAAKQLHLDPWKAQQLSNMLTVYARPTGADVAIGNMQGAYPQIWLSTIDRNHVWDAVAEARTATTKDTKGAVADNTHARTAQDAPGGEREVSYHMTENPYFELDPEITPSVNSTIGGDMGEPGLFVTKSPEFWRNGHDYVRPFVAEIEHPAGLRSGYYESRDQYLPATLYPQSTVKRLIPWEGYVGEAYENTPYTGQDVREMTPEEHNEHIAETNAHIRNDRAHMLAFPCSHCGSPEESYNECMACGKLEDPAAGQGNDHYMARGYLPKFRGTGDFFKSATAQVMYHYSPDSNRASIMQNGLDPAFDQTGDEESDQGIYLDTVSTWVRYPGTDLWEVNVEGLPLEIDPSNDFAGKLDEYSDKGDWYVCYERIGPERLRLMDDPGSAQEPRTGAVRPALDHDLIMDSLGRTAPKEMGYSLGTAINCYGPTGEITGTLLYRVLDTGVIWVDSVYSADTRAGLELLGYLRSHYPNQQLEGYFANKRLKLLAERYNEGLGHEPWSDSDRRRMFFDGVQQEQRMSAQRVSTEGTVEYLTWDDLSPKHHAYLTGQNEKGITYATPDEDGWNYPDMRTPAMHYPHENRLVLGQPGWTHGDIDQALTDQGTNPGYWGIEHAYHAGDPSLDVPPRWNVQDDSTFSRYFEPDEADVSDGTTLVPERDAYLAQVMPLLQQAMPAPLYRGDEPVAQPWEHGWDMS